MAGGRPVVMIVDDHAVLAHALAAAFETEGFDTVVLDGDELTHAAVLTRARRDRPDVVLLDVMISSELSGLDLVRPLNDLGVPVLVMTASQDALLLARCLEQGAAGVFDKTLPLRQLMSYVADAARGDTVLSPAAREEMLAVLRSQRTERHALLRRFNELTAREAEVLRHLLDGRSSDEIAALQTVAVSTVRTQVKAVFRKLGVNSRLAAVTLARHAGWPEA